MSAQKPHLARRVAESFGVDAGRYDRARPGYPDALIQRILAASPGRTVLDVGCGTGIAARQFQAAGCTVLGVEPDARMAEFARRSGIEVEVATFEAWEAADRRFDAVAAGQAWHWVDPVAGAAKAAHLLRPDGLLAVFGHVFDPPSEVADALADTYRRVVPDAPSPTQQGSDGSPPSGAMAIYQRMFATFADGIREADGLTAPQQWRFDWEQPYTRDAWLDLLPTTGGLTRLAPEQLAQVLAGVGAAIDDMGGGFTMHYSTLAVTAERTAA